MDIASLPLSASAAAIDAAVDVASTPAESTPAASHLKLSDASLARGAHDAASATLQAANSKEVDANAVITAVPLNAIDPATRELIGSVLATPAAQLPEIVARAQAAGRAWATLTFSQRAPRLARLRDAVAQRALEIAETIARSMGRPVVEALTFEVLTVVRTLDDCIAHGGDAPVDQPGPAAAQSPMATNSAAAMPTRDHMSDSTPDGMSHSASHAKSHGTSHPSATARGTTSTTTPAGRDRIFWHEAATVATSVSPGVVCVIAPVSVSFAAAMGPAVRALAAGNAVIVKTASSAPLVGALIERLFDSVFSDLSGLAQVVHGARDIGALLATAPGVTSIVFTGSAKSAHALQAALAPLQRPALLDVGGANALIVCADAHLERAANATVFSRFSNNGQSGASIQRVYVLREVASAFIHKVMHKVRALKSGPYSDPFSEMGPLANGRNLQQLRSLLQDALDQRALLLTGGLPAHVTGRNHGERRSAEGQGWYWRPTVITEVNPSQRILHEVVAGPLLPIQVVADEGEAITFANGAGSDDGGEQNAYVALFTADLARAEQIAARLRAGTVAINDVLIDSVMQDLQLRLGSVAVNHAPVTGSLQEDSGDRRQASARTRKRIFSDGKTLLIDDGRFGSEPHWFPYSAAKLRATLAAIESSPSNTGIQGAQEIELVRSGS